MGNDYKSSSLHPTNLGFTARLARVAAYDSGSCFSSILEWANTTGGVPSVISNMQSSLSMRGTTRRWWNSAMTAATDSLVSAFYLRTAVRGATLARLDSSEMPWLHNAGLSFSTFPV